VTSMHGVLAALEVRNIISSKFPAPCRPVVLPFTPGQHGERGGGDLVSSGNRSAWLHRMRRNGWARVAAQLTVPVALGLLIGGVLAFQAGSSNNMVHPVPLGAVATPTPSWGKHPGLLGPAPTPGWIKPSATAATPATTTPAPATAG